MNEQLATLLFKRRNAIFPVTLAVLLAIFQPRAWGDPLGSILLGAGIALVVLGQGLRALTIGLKYIKRGGKKGKFYANDLVTDGIFSHCRNPLYVGNVLLGIGFLFVAGNLYALVIGSALIVWAYSLIVGGEERYLRGRFGESYEAYCRDVPRWMFRLGGLGNTLGASRFDWVRLVNKEYGTLYTSLLIPVGLIGWKLYIAGGRSMLNDNLLVLGIILGGGTVGYAVARFLKKTRRLEPRETAATEPTDPLERLRKNIDQLDARLLRVLNERAATVLEIFAYKNANGIEHFDSGRTHRILDRIVAQNQGPLTDDQVERIFQSMLEQILRLGAEPSEEASTTRADVVVRAPVSGTGAIANA